MSVSHQQQHILSKRQYIEVDSCIYFYCCIRHDPVHLLVQILKDSLVSGETLILPQWSKCCFASMAAV